MELHQIYLGLAVIFGFIMAWGIGANDVSNAMGASVGSRAITIRQAIIIAAIFEFLGAFLAGGEVTDTIRKNIIDPALFIHDPDSLIYGMLASLLASGCWLLLASLFGWPVSTTHTIVGAIIGFGAINIGVDSIQWQTVLSIMMGWILSPLLGAAISYVLFSTAQRFILDKPNPLLAAKKVVPFYIFLTCWIIYMIAFSKLDHMGVILSLWESNLFSIILACLTTLIGKKFINHLSLNQDASTKCLYANVEKIFSILMVFTACAMAFAHGSNDVANAIGPVAAIASITQKQSNLVNSSQIPIWVLLMGASGIVVGLTMYGHKVIATVGNKITQLTPSRGFCATLSAATTVVLASSTGLPISTTHTLVGGILGIGLARGIHALNLNVIKTIFVSWMITLPAGSLLSILFFQLLKVAFTSYS